MSTRETFVDWKDGSHLKWMRDCREAGDVLRLLVGALDDDWLEGANLTRFGIGRGGGLTLRKETETRNRI